MNLISRIKHLWKLSEYEPGQATDETKTPGTIVSMIVKKPKQEGRFIKFQGDPIKTLVAEPMHDEN